MGKAHFSGGVAIRFSKNGHPGCVPAAASTLTEATQTGACSEMQTYGVALHCSIALCCVSPSGLTAKE